MTVMDDYLDTAMEAEDAFPCKGCGEILEEGKAFELAGNRWHLNCFRCNTCGTLLDSDANLLLLGDGSLICNNCTYSCSACGNKIEDLAILTGDQAFCATCFRCRNCKRKIENLRYARTSQGIFCMSCHESLMARRRKKSKAAAQAKLREKDGSPMITDKSLPALPPNAALPMSFVPERATPDSDTPTELSPRPNPRPPFPRNESSSRSSSRPARSPERAADPVTKENNLGVPQPSYRNNRNSAVISGDLNTADGDSFFIPVALDPSPVASVTPRSTSDVLNEAPKKTKDGDYFAISKGSGSEKKTDSQSSTPHIAFQEKARHSSSDYENPPAKAPSRKLSKRDKRIPITGSPVVADDRPSRAANGKSDEFKLQDAPKSKKFGGSRNNSQSGIKVENAARSSNGVLPPTAESESPPGLSTGETDSTPRSSSQEVRFRDDDGSRPSPEPSRADSANSKAILRKELPPGAGRPPLNGKTISAASTKTNGTDDSTLSSSLTPPRPGPPESKLSDTYMQPRAPPQPPPHGSVDASSTNQETGSPKASPKLPRWSAGGEFTMDEDMARILGTDEGSSSILRRVSNAVRHGRTNSTEAGNPQSKFSHARSISETTRATVSPRWPTTPIVEDSLNGRAQDISSPISLAANQNDPALLKRQLRNSEQRVAELERQFATEKDLKNLNKKLQEKRKTVSVLDTQTEIMIRQLEVLAGYVERAKDTKEPVDPRDLEESALKDFVQKLDKVKQSMAASIEQLHGERDVLIDEKNKAMADRDRALLEFEQLSSKNAQLADLNNDLTHQIQGRFKAASTDLKSTNGLGIYGHGQASSGNLDTSSVQTGTATLAGSEADDQLPVLEGPTVVNIRKGQVRKFNWKKGSKAVASNISKGVKGAVVALAQGPEMQRNALQQLSGDNIGLPYNMTMQSVESPIAYGPTGQANRVPAGMTAGQDRQGFGFFGKKSNLPKSMTLNNISTPTIAEAPNVLFGSELCERADYERRQIPSVVTRCIEEVELRGMDVEGIYRKTGGNSQVKTLQEGFEKSEDFDISDPAIDITAITSVLKQYFRKLPTPLLTYDVYDRVMDSNNISNDAERCSHLQKTFRMLPQQHRDCLEFLMFHLARVAARERENLMSPKNIAVVFAPSIMRDVSIEREMTDMHAKNLAVQFVVENSHIIFAE